MGFIAGIIGFVVMIAILNYVIKQVEKKEKIDQSVATQVFENGQIIELDKEPIKTGDIFCKKCKHLRTNPYRGGRYECHHPDAYENTGVDVITGQQLVRRIEDWNIYLKWNKDCNCSKFQARE